MQGLKNVLYKEVRCLTYAESIWTLKTEAYQVDMED